MLLVNTVDELANGLAGFGRTQLTRGSVVIAAANKENIVGADQHTHPPRVDVGGDVSTSQMANVQRTAGVRHPCSDHGPPGPVYLALDRLDIWNVSVRSAHQLTLIT